MYVRTIKRKNKDGSVVEYVQLAHNVRHPEKGYSKAEVAYSFGRRDQLDLEALKRLINSLGRFLDPEEVLQLQAQSSGSLKFISSRPYGGAYLLRTLWKRLKIDHCLNQALKNRAFTAPVAEALFALTANRALAPQSKLAVEEWVAKDVYLDNDQELQVQHFYRGMDFLLEHQETIQKEVYRSTANLLNLSVDLIFFDTTNIYFEIDDPGDSQLKAYGKSKQKRDDLPQATIGLAVTREGIPVRCWIMPGNQNDAACVDQIQKDLNGWQMNRVVWVMDRGMTSEEDRRLLQRAGGHYILGEKLRGNDLNKEVLSRGGRFKEIRENLQIKEVTITRGSSTRRFVIVYNPEQAEYDRKTRERVLERTRNEIEALGDKQGKARCRLLTNQSMGRYVKELKNGKLRINLKKVREEEKLDGKYLLSSSDPSLTAEEIALGYKQLYAVESAFRTLKTSQSLRPVYHTRDDRIRSHVLLCWLALLLVRVAEVETGLSWRRIRAEMERLHLGEFFGKDGRILQCTELTKEQRNILKKLKIKPPKTFKKISVTP